MENNLTLQIQKLIDKTKEGKISWKLVAPNNVRWLKQNAERLFTTSLQKQGLPSNSFAMTNRVILNLTIQATNPNEIVLQINTNDDDYCLGLLIELFDIAQNSSREYSANIIDNLLDDI